MENEFVEDDANPNNPSRVRISITRASFSEDDSDLESPEKSTRQIADSDSSIDEQETERMMQEHEQIENEQLHEGEKVEEHNDATSTNDFVRDSRSTEDEQVTKAFENGVTLQDEADAATNDRRESVGKVNNDEPGESAQINNKEDSSASSPAKSPAMEMIGDRVLIERDGKFELVDVSEIKAEYYEMLGISPETTGENNGSEEKGSETTEIDDKEIPEEKPESRPRPKTTSVHEQHRRNENKRNTRSVDRTRSQSAKAIRQRNDEYAHIRSEYAMTEQQLEIRRKCREAKLRRQKEEEEREREEQQRKRDDADRAFQVWLYNKIDAAKQARLNQPDPKAALRAKEEKESNAQSAYSEWLDMKRQQDKTLRQLEERRREEEASQYTIRDRQLCDEAFRRWLRRKKQEEELKKAAAAKKKKKKPKLKRKEQAPLNSHKIRYYEYYGYRNTVSP